MAEPFPEARGDLDQDIFGEDSLRLVPFRLGHLLVGDILTFDVFVPTAENPGKVIRAWPKGEPFLGDEKNLGWAYFPVSETGSVLQYFWSRLEGEGFPLEASTLGRLTDALLVWIQHFYLQEDPRTPDQLKLARDLIHHWLLCWEGLRCDPSTLEVLRRHDSGVFSHCLNVGLLALAFSPYLEETRENREVFALGAILHDLGMMVQGAEVFHLTGPLSDQEWKEIKRHPDLGADLLKSLGGLTDSILQMVRQHHESLDGSGYPQGLVGEAIHPWARVLKILDSYEAITSLRPWRPPLGRRQAFHIMTSAWSSQKSYDPHYLSLFLDFCQGKTPPDSAGGEE
jgi:putative nucleotidyltransferase with HDIG domain